MDISLKNIGKKYKSDWIFRGIDHKFNSGESHAILGQNGSGKSTLLKIISGALMPTEGEIEYQSPKSRINPDHFFNQVSIAAPYLGLVSEFTVYEMAAFHNNIKGLKEGMNTEELINITGLSLKKGALIGNLSSGMLQRFKLGIAIFSSTPILLLDEPTVNLDEKGVKWYGEMMDKYNRGKTIIICSNHKEEECGFCNKKLIMENYK